MNQTIKGTLEKQLQILSERSTRERGEILPDITRAMIDLAKFLNCPFERDNLKELFNEEIPSLSEDYLLKFISYHQHLPDSPTDKLEVASPTPKSSCLANTARPLSPKDNPSTL